jgi:carbonic anhydrase/acetyltransferase-like protein (isoleucine patch superfamily)
MIIARNGFTPQIDPSATIASSAQIVGNVTIGPRTFVDYNVVIASSGPPIRIADHVVVFANSVVRSVGGLNRPAFPVDIGDHTLIAPLSVLTGCRIGRLTYIATGGMVLQGASVGDGTRIGIGAIVHVGTQLPAKSRVGMRFLAVPGDSQPVITADIDEARQRVQEADFFETTFGLPQDTPLLHETVIQQLLDEVESWRDDVLQA